MENGKLLNRRIFLYLTEFFAGMAVMAVELGASRLLAPYFSSSQIVWTIIIGTIMIAMALGNIYGGKSADKDPDPGKLYMRLLIAAVWISAIPFLGKFVILGVSGLLVVTVSNGFLILAAFIACMIIFVFPLFLLGTVTPSLVKYTVDSLENSGGTVGKLGAFNTIGSILGTFLPTFVTIPSVGTSLTFIIFSGILLILGLIYFISEKRRIIKCAVCTLLFVVFSVLGAAGGFAFWEDNLLYEGESVYNYLQVKDTESEVVLSTNVLFGVQSVMKKDGGLTGMYYDYALAAPVMAETDGAKAPSVLVLGMGTGTFAAQCARYFPGGELCGVEIDRKITGLAEEYFGMPDEIDVITYDGRAFLSATDKTYDVVMVDAYQDITIPFQMSTLEFFALVYDRLNDGGIMVVNMNMQSDGEGSINQYLCDTISRVFPSVYTADVPYTTNRELFASKGEDAALRLETGTEEISSPELRELMADISQRLTEYDRGDYILTDDKAPVELLGMEVIDALISEELGYYREVFKTQGIRGILNSF